MDHLPIPSQPFRHPPYPRVPYLCAKVPYYAESVGFDRFAKFPSRFGLSAEDALRMDWSARDFDYFTAILQSWLYFGMMIEVFSGAGLEFDPKDFTCGDAAGHWEVSTTALDRYICYWVAVCSHNDEEENREQGQHVETCLQLANSVFNAIVSNMASASTDWPLESPIKSILLSIAVLGETLGCAEANFFAPIKRLRWQLPGLTQSLVDAGWCIGDIINITRDCDSSTILYLSNLDRNVSTGDHTRCTSHSGCRAYQIDWNTYTTKHVEGCPTSQCNVIGPAVDGIGRILRDGNTPLITMDLSQTPSRMSIVRDREGSAQSKYVAISHVWSDGLGNPLANRMPRCQLDRIQSLANGIDPKREPPVPFWIDTICVPIAPELKNLAIMSMGSVYHEAEDVLVFDQVWKDVPMATPALELMIRIKYSTWATRLWTFQEARLSRNLWFHLRDGSVPLRSAGNTHQLGQTLHQISDMLLEHNRYKPFSQIPELHLARALATPPAWAEQVILDRQWRFAALPSRLEDASEEDARLDAIEWLDEHPMANISLSEVWRSRVTPVDPQSRDPGRDSQLRDALENLSPNAVVSHALNARSLVKGMAGARTLLRNHDPGHMLVDVVRGLHGRTTSRLEDETICLSVLLHLDVSKILAVPVLHWRRKDLLARFGQFVSYLAALTPQISYFTTLARFINKLLRYTHDERMKIFLSQIVFFSKDIIFWDTERLQHRGWAWAPFSFLRSRKELKFDFSRSSPHGFVTDEGFRVRAHSIRLLRPYSTSGAGISAGKYNHLCIDWAIDQVENLPPWARRWQWATLHDTVTWPPRRSLKPERETEDASTWPLVILLDERRDGTKGCLVSVIEEKKEAVYGKHIMTLEILGRSPNQPSLHCTGQWSHATTWYVR
ncbi:MAG: hypothetical protein Q9168_005363 [Polycauliona sp. 1 TL-2023]